MVGDPCNTTPLTIDSTILSSLAITYVLNDAIHIETLVDSKVTPSVPGCPNLEFSFTDQSGGAIDGAVFTYISISKAFHVFSVDPSKVAIYPLRLTANFIGYMNTAILDFQVSIDDPCSLSTLTIDASTSIFASPALTQTVS